MNIEDIQKAITKLSPDELSRFCEWLNEYASTTRPTDVKDLRTPIEDTLKKARGSLKGSGALEALMEERRKG